MPKFRKIVAILLILTMAIWIPGGVFAEQGSGSGDDDPAESQDSGSDSSNDANEDPNDDVNDDSSDPNDDVNDDSSDPNDGIYDDVNDDTIDDTPEHKALNAQIEALKIQIDDLKTRLEAAKDSGNTVLYSELKAQLNDLLDQKGELENEDEQMDGDEHFKPWAEEKQKLEAAKDLLEDMKDALEKELDALKDQYEEQKDTATQEELTALLVQIQTKEAEFLAKKAEFKTALEAMKQIMNNLYTEKERHDLDSLRDQLEREGFKVIPINNVLFHGENVKFDAPPVIRDGRVLIPVRAISASLGADVSWDPDERVVTITKDAKVITFELGEDYLMVDGIKVPIDVPSQIVNGRTVLPLRAIVETLGLVVKWEPETETVSIE